MYKKINLSFIYLGNSLSDDENYDWECTRKASLPQRDPPLLYDLNNDPGERYPLNSIDYSDILKKMAVLKQKLSKKISWGPSEVEKGTSQKAFPCCGSTSHECQPFPTCCNCS